MAKFLELFFVSVGTLHICNLSVSQWECFIKGTISVCVSEHLIFVVYLCICGNANFNKLVFQLSVGMLNFSKLVCWCVGTINFSKLVCLCNLSVHLWGFMP